MAYFKAGTSPDLLTSEDYAMSYFDIVLRCASRSLRVALSLWFAAALSVGSVSAQFLVRNINTAGGGANGSTPAKLVDLSGTIFFAGTAAGTARELWKSDGTEAGTLLVRDVNQGNRNGIGDNPELVAVGETIFFIATDGVSGYELWKSDGTEPGTIMVRDIRPGAESSMPDIDGLPAALTISGSTLYFVANDGTHGFELWKSDGTAEGTVMVRDLNPGGDAFSDQEIPMIDINGTIFFGADDGTSGAELWKSDGTGAGTVPVKDIYPGAESSVLKWFVDLEGTLLFSALDGATGVELWKSDGTAGGTTIVRDILDGTGSSVPTGLTLLDGFVYFAAADGDRGIELWRSDGTSAGTTMIEVHQGAAGSLPLFLTPVGDRLYFLANDAEHGDELRLYDPSTGAVTLVRDINPGTPHGLLRGLSQLVSFDGKLYVGARDGGASAVGPLELEPWVSDGTEAGTRLLRDIYPGTVGSAPKEFTVSGENLFFSAKDDRNGQELWALKRSGSSSTPPVVSGDASLRISRTTPNPARETITISYTLAQAGKATMTLHDILGRRSAILLDTYLPEGSHTVECDVRDLPAGLYSCRLVAGDAIVSRTVVVRK